MGTSILSSVLQKLCVRGKGILAADESVGTITDRFKETEIPQPADTETRRRYRDLLFSHPGLNEHTCGIILFEETVGQRNNDGEFFPQFLASREIIPGIKLDQGKVPHPRFERPQSITRGLDGLEERIRRLVQQSDGTLAFGEWRQVIDIGPHFPNWDLIESALDDMAQYAAICQAEGLLPMTEPEVLMDGDHSLARCAEVTGQTLKILYDRLKLHRVNIAETLLKPNMVVSGKPKSKVKPSDRVPRGEDSPEEVARQTLSVLTDHVPREVPGIAFLSGGQTPDEATRNLRAIVAEARRCNVACWLSFSFGRALQETVMKAWKGDDSQVEIAQDELLRRLHVNGAATEGR